MEKRLPRLKINNGTIEGLKWLALLLMTGDHIDEYIYNSTIHPLYKISRLAMPIFVCILAFNLARPGVFFKGAYQRTLKRLLLFGVLATPAIIGLGGLWWGNWWPLNIMFTLLVMTLVIYFIEKDNPFFAISVLLIGGSLVEYWWPAIVLGVAVWFYTKKPSIAALLIAFIACASLWWINGDMWALLVLPLLFLANKIEMNIPRIKWAFYVYYPLHLSLLWLIRIPMSQVGYLFFTKGAIIPK